MAIGTHTHTHTHTHIITLNVNGDWLNGYKNKTHIYAVYKKPTSDRNTYR